eukprot:2317630-Alexandrium_andersonii.AAC.1
MACRVLTSPSSWRNLHVESAPCLIPQVRRRRCGLHQLTRQGWLRGDWGCWETSWGGHPVPPGSPCPR